MQPDYFQLSFQFKEGATASEMASKLRFHAGLLEGLPPKEASRTTAGKTVKKETQLEFDTDQAEDSADSFGDAQPDAPQTNASWDETDDSDFSTPEPAPKTKKAPKVTADDVNDACRLKAQSVGGKAGREQVLTILKKQFKTTSVSELKPEQYAAVVKAMQV